MIPVLCNSRLQVIVRKHPYTIGFMDLTNIGYAHCYFREITGGRGRQVLDSEAFVGAKHACERMCDTGRKLPSVRELASWVLSITVCDRLYKRFATVDSLEDGEEEFKVTVRFRRIHDCMERKYPDLIIATEVASNRLP
jgi:hypothetical protein